MKTNKKKPTAPKVFTHNGAPAVVVGAEEKLNRSIMACLLWEDGFYEDGQTIADRIKELVPQVKAESVRDMAIEARHVMHLRHVPLLLLREMVRHEGHRELVGNAIPNVIARADELAELVALYWKDGKKPLPNQFKKGLAKAFTRFDEYQLSKYNKQDATVKLRDVLFLTHAKPTDKKQEKLWKKLVQNELKTPDTWETNLSAGKDKKETWTRLIKEEKLGGLALLRNLRNMREANVDPGMVRKALKENEYKNVLPFRFISAAKHAPDFEPELEAAMFKSLAGLPKLKGRTALVVDVSGSMFSNVAGKSDLTAFEGAAALAVLLREIADTDVFTFSYNLVQVPARRGFALRDAMDKSQLHGGTNLGAAIAGIPKGYERVIVLTDEQSSDSVGKHNAKLGYMVNVAAYQNGVGQGQWHRISGWSEQIVRYITECEANYGNKSKRASTKPD